MTTYQQRVPFADRLRENQELTKKYPDRVCIIVNADSRVELKKHKFLTPDIMLVGQIQSVIRKHIADIRPTTALFSFTEKNVMPPRNATVGAVQKNHANDDGNLYLTIRPENTFG